MDTLKISVRLLPGGLSTSCLGKLQRNRLPLLARRRGACEEVRGGDEPAGW